MGDELGLGHWLIDTAGVGSVIVVVVGLGFLAAYVYMLRWIRQVPAEQPVVVEVTPEAEEVRAEGVGA